MWAKVVKPIRQRQTTEDMAREQNFQQFDRAGFDKIIEELDVQDSDGQLLRLLTA
jgi:hypothetical protein